MPRAAVLAVALAAALGIAPAASAGPSAPSTPRADDLPSPAAVKLVNSKCGSCHAAPTPGSRGQWSSASVNMHVRRIPMSAADWALVRRYLGDEDATAER